MDLSIVVVNWKSHGYLDLLLRSVWLLRDEVREIIVVDNDSGQDPPPGLSDFPNARWIESSRNLGFAGAANLGIRLVDTPFVLLLNPDVEVIPNSLRTLYQTIQRLPGAIVVCGPLLDAEGKPQEFQLRPLPTPAAVLLQVLFRRSQPGPSRWPFEEGLDGVEQPAAAYWLIRKSAWDELGGMDESFHPAWFEDVDFCRRAISAGWQFFYRDDSPALHRGAVSLETLGRSAFYRIYYRNLLRYLQKHHPRAHPWLWLPVQLGKYARICLRTSS